jgi:exonuclease SbcC
MKIKKIKLDNFMPYVNQEFDLERLSGPTLIVGKHIGGNPGESNGAGKSTLFEAIVWSLFGVSRGKSDDELIRQGSDEMVVTNVFEIDGTTYEIIRSKKRGKSQSLWFSDLTHDKKLRENSVKATEAAIIRALGMDYDIFSNTVYSPQKKLDLFPSQLPSKRKEVLGAILEIDNYADVEEKARRLAANYERDSLALAMAISRVEGELGQEKINPEEIARLESEIAGMTDKIENAKFILNDAMKEVEELRSKATFFNKVSGDLSQSRQALDRLVLQKEYAQKERVQQLAGVDVENQKLATMIEREPKVVGALSEITGKIKTYDQVSQKLTSLREEQTVLRVQRDGFKREIEGMDKELARLRKKFDQIYELGPQCPTCHSQLTPEVQKKIVEDITKEGTDRRLVYDQKMSEVKQAEDRIQQVESEVRSLSGAVSEQSELQRDLTNFQRELDQIGMAKTQIQNGDSRRQQIEDIYVRRFAEIDTERARSEESIRFLEAELKKFAYSETDAAKAVQKVGVLQAEFDRLSKDRDQRNQVLGGLMSRKEAYDRKSAQLEADRSRYKESKDQEFIYKELTRAFSKNGIPALIMDNALAEIQSEVNKVMERLTGGKIRVEFSTQKELKTGKLAETLDIIVSDNLGARDFNLYSGGEAARVALAIRLALAKVISRRAGKKIECVFIDEISDLDPAGADAFAQTINQISGEYKQILVVTHMPHLKDQFQNVLTIIKDRDGSHIEMEAVTA